MSLLASLVLFTGLGWAATGARQPASGAEAVVTVDVPAGWEDLTEERRSPEVVAVFKGPQESSFVLTRLKGGGLGNTPQRKALLLDVLSGLNRKTGLAFIPRREMKTFTFKNDVTAHCVYADLGGQPRLILAITEFRNRFYLATLRSSVPDTMLPSILRTVHSSTAEAARGLYRRGASTDGQLGFILPEGLWLRTVAPREKGEGIVAAILGFDSMLSFKKLDEGSTSAGEEAALVKLVLKSASGVEPASISAVEPLATPAGPGILYAWAKVKTPQVQTQVAAGFLPWGYWGYSLWAAGPRAKDLMEAGMAGLRAGPSADPKVLAATPGLADKWSLRSKILTALGSLVGGVFAAVLLLRMLGGRKNRYVASTGEGG
ncbi:MAG: hypothetical protein HZB91_12500 [Elusimicrobia bacterium]|nr:hypothetical protein [Elusimicrobiota bacterium]